MTFVDKLITSFENNEYIIGIFFENSKAFDIADHSLLLCKIPPYGITDNALGLSEQCIMFTLMYSYVCVLYCFASHEKLNGHPELTVTTVITAPGPNDHDSVTARLGHSSVTARSQLSHGDHGSVMARSQLKHGPGHGSVTAGCDHFAHRELTVS